MLALVKDADLAGESDQVFSNQANPEFLAPWQPDRYHVFWTHGSTSVGGIPASL